MCCSFHQTGAIVRSETLRLRQECASECTEFAKTGAASIFTLPLRARRSILRHLEAAAAMMAVVNSQERTWMLCTLR